MRFNTINKWLDWLETNHPNEIDLGLERVSSVGHALNLNFDNIKVVTVAGTNGKGSCVSVLGTLLGNSGYNIGCFTSPHFLYFNERIAINNKAVDDDVIIESFERIDQCRGEISLTYFEFATLAAMDIFCRSNLDIVILEVGLGGRLDSVNIIDPDVAIVTSVDIDHVDWLGHDRESIGFEKAGIFRSNKPAICADPNPPQSVIDTANSKKSPLFLWGRDFELVNTGNQLWCWEGTDRNGNKIKFEHLTLPQLPKGSIAAALQAIELLKLDEDNNNQIIDYQAISEICLPGRFQQMVIAGKEIILDVAHNPAAAINLANELKENPREGKTFALVAIMADKDVTGIIRALTNSFDSWYVGDLENNPRALKAAELALVLKKQSIENINVYSSVMKGYQSVLNKMGQNDRLVVFGSFFTVAEVMNAQKLTQ